MPGHPLAKLAWKVKEFLGRDGARHWFRAQCFQYFRDCADTMSAQRSQRPFSEEAVQRWQNANLQGAGIVEAFRTEARTALMDGKKGILVPPEVEKALAELKAAALDYALPPSLVLQRPRTIADKVAISAALHDTVCTSEEKIIEPKSLTDVDGIVWIALVRNVENLQKDKRHAIEAWFKDVEAAFRAESARSPRKTASATDTFTDTPKKKPKKVNRAA